MDESLSHVLSSNVSSVTKTDPYSIHYSDSPSTILVTPLLTGDNYRSWSHAITIALRAKSKLGFVDGSLPKPTETIADWERCYDLVGSWILNSVSPEIYPSILHFGSVAQIWSNLKESFSQSTLLKYINSNTLFLLSNRMVRPCLLISPN